MRSALPSLLVAILVACATNPTPRCAADGDCERNEACYRGLCLPAMEVTDAGPVSPCPVGRMRCDDRCINPLTDRNHCGVCGRMCRGDEDHCELGACVD